MTFWYILAAILVTMSALTTISMVDKPREETTGGVAAVVTILNAGIIFLLIYGAVHL